MLRGERMVDLALDAVELIDRNLYERTCDVRWWATDSAVVDCAAAPNDISVAHVSQTRVLLVDRDFRVIAASDGQGLLTEKVALAANGPRSGFQHDRAGTLVASHATPGYETYRGLGWYGVILRSA